MVRDEAIERLRALEPRFRALGATALFLFGSTARGEASVGSDIDLFVDYDPSGRFSLLDLVEAKQIVEDDFGLPADVATRGSLHRAMRDEIERQAVKIF